MISEHEKSLDKYQKDLEKYAETVEKAVQKIIKEIEKGKLPEYEDSYRRKGIVIPIGIECPYEPILDLTKIDRLIKTLEIASEDSIQISSEDAQIYLG